jgi:16S rRNA (cytidine1402-2'-O)-methyltransferase
MSNIKKGTLYLVPTPLGEGSLATWLTPWLTSLLNKVVHFVAEDEKMCRRFLRSAGFTASFDEVQINLLNEHTPPGDVPSLIAPCISGHDLVLMSDAGCPGIADPGSDLVRTAHQRNVNVIPIPGPSSIFMALMSSGLNGQKFSFHGYLPRERKDRIHQIKVMEQQAISNSISQIFMDTPYRNMNVLEDLMINCKATTLLCIATDINCVTEYIRTRSINEWKTNLPQINKRPCIFVLGT